MNKGYSKTSLYLEKVNYWRRCNTTENQLHRTEKL